MRWFLRLALVGLVVGLVMPVATAQATTTAQTLPLEVTFTACGETISLSGSATVVVTVQELADGGALVSYHLARHALSGTSASGIPYHSIGAYAFTTVVIPAGVYTVAFPSQFRIVGTMGAPTFYVKMLLHLTITPNGDVTASFVSVSNGCV